MSIRTIALSGRVVAEPGHIRNRKLMLTLVLLGFGLSVMIATIATHAPAFTYDASYMALSTQADIQMTVIPSQAQPTVKRTSLASALSIGQNASQSLKRVSQLDCGQYASQAECTTWAYSACSTAAMTEVIDAYGHHYRITDILQVESALGEITPQLGLVEDSGVAHTLAHFGFATEWGYHWALDQVIAIANTGFPVIVGWPPDRYEGGHLVVVVGGDSNSVKLADSSRYNRTSLSRTQFMNWWAGFAAIAMPSGPDYYQRLAAQDAQQAGIRPAIFTRQINQESGFQPFVISPAGALGIAQFMPETARGVGLNPWDPVASLQAAARYMAEKLAYYGGDYGKALASYNAGSGAVDTAIRLYGSNWLTHMPAETQGYVRDILG